MKMLVEIDTETQRVVSIKPTPEMVKADPYGMGYGRLHAVWARLLAASPQPAPVWPMTGTEFREACRAAQIAFCMDRFSTFEEALVRAVEAHHGIKSEGA
jgi:hypothetical protein